MEKEKYYLLCLVFLALNTTLWGQTPAFPDAEGGGMFTWGGRAGKVLAVTNLNDAGPGSLRAAIMAHGCRTVIFRVSGTIALKSKLILENDSITIAGQTAPGDGICLSNFPFYIKANNVIIRFLRCRMGDSARLEDDALGAMNVSQLMIDHCSISWSVDECLSVYRSKDITVQWNIIAHSLSRSFHTKGAHGFGGIWGGENASFHHNLIAGHSSRNPRFASDGFAPVDFRNNVVFNWGYKSAYGGGRGGRINYVNNYYKPGPATQRWVLLDAAEDGTGSYYIRGNILDGRDSISTNNSKGVTGRCDLVDQPFPVPPVKTDHALLAYQKVLSNAGCCLARDVYDKRILDELASGVAYGGKSFAGGNKGIIDSQNDVGGWPLLFGTEPPKDSDADGMPDRWELDHKLNPRDARDGSAYCGNTGYTNLEVYLNELAAPALHYSIVKDSIDNKIIGVYPDTAVSGFAKKLKPLGRILESPEYYVWCCAPIYDPEGQVHVFYSRWPKKYGMGGWIGHSEIAHAVAAKPEGPYVFKEVVLAPRKGFFDATTCHNPHVQYVNGTYYLFYMGTSDGSVFSKRIGLASASSLAGPWIRDDEPLLEVGAEGEWDDCCTTNPAFILTSAGEARLYYKSWNAREYKNASGAVRGNRKYGLATATGIRGPYARYKGNPIIDFSGMGGNKQVEDAFIYWDRIRYCMLMRDMGYFSDAAGLFFESSDGLNWSAPQIAWFPAAAYIDEPDPPATLKRYGRFERPQLLIKDGKPRYLFNALQGGRYGTASGFVFEIQDK